MIIDTRVVPEGYSTLTRLTDLQSVRDDLPVFSEDIALRAEIDRSAQTIYMQVSFSGTFTLECSRCLESFQHEISGSFRLVLKEDPEKQGASVDDDVVDFYFNSRHEQIDISPAVFDEIMVNLPLMPLCSESCTGIEIADSDGVQGNNEKSESVTEEIDPRWEALKKLKK